MAKQLHIFLENRPGRLSLVTEVLGNKCINIIGFTIQDRGDFGLIKLLVDKAEAAHLALTDKGFASALKEVLVVSIKDKPGNLHKLADVFSGNKINIIDAHGFVGPGNKGICCIEIDGKSDKKLEKVLEKKGFSVLSEEDLYEL